MQGSRLVLLQRTIEIRVSERERERDLQMLSRCEKREVSLLEEEPNTLGVFPVEFAGGESNQPRFR